MLVNRGFEETKSTSESQPAVGEEERRIYEEMAELTRCVEMMTQTIREMEAPVSSTSEQLPLANVHLGELAKMTEEGTHKIMAVTETMEDNRRNVLTLLRKLESQSRPDQQEEIHRIIAMLEDDSARLTDITVALSFQDLVAQRVAKLMTVLDEVQHKMLKVLVIFGIHKRGGNAKKEGRGYEMLEQLEASKNTALRQDLVDDILSQLGCK